MLTLDDAANNVMQTSLIDSDYLFLIWPKKATIRDLEHGREMVVFQIDSMLKFAKRKSDRAAAADAEYESWMKA